MTTMIHWLPPVFAALAIVGGAYLVTAILIRRPPPPRAGEDREL